MSVKYSLYNILPYLERYVPLQSLQELNSEVLSGSRLPGNEDAYPRRPKNSRECCGSKTRTVRV